MPDQLAVTAFADLLVNDNPLLDVRAPAEFQRGAFPCAHNIPLLEDSERKAVGIRYKEVGQETAIALGEELVSGELRANRIQSWLGFIKTNPYGAIYCFRGGLRSKTVQTWLAAEGFNIPIIQGGYKALRRFCLNTLDRVSKQEKFIVIGGKTGCAKTHLLKQLSSSIDLEGNANHRGSSFGRRSLAQPNQINFENSLAIDFLKLKYEFVNKLFIEDESKAIGALSVPLVIHRQMSVSPLVIIEESFESRVDTILNDYIFSNYLDCEAHDSEHFKGLFADSLLSALMRIRRRLGDDHYAEINQIMKDALAADNLNNSAALHRNWISKLLNNYYDPMYEYQLEKKSHRIVFRGDKVEFLKWARGINRAK